jgi:hypothetical protein
MRHDIEPRRRSSPPLQFRSLLRDRLFSGSGVNAELDRIEKEAAAANAVEAMVALRQPQ